MTTLKKAIIFMVISLTTFFAHDLKSQVNFGAGGFFSVYSANSAVNRITTRFNTYELPGEQLKVMSPFGAMGGLNFNFRYRFPRVFGVEFGYSIANSEAKDLYQNSPSEKSYKNILTYRQSVLNAGIEMRASNFSVGAAYGMGTQQITWRKTNDSKFSKKLLEPLQALDMITVHLGYDWQPTTRFSVAFRPFFEFGLNSQTDFAIAESAFVQQGTTVNQNFTKIYSYGLRVILINGPNDEED